MSSLKFRRNLDEFVKYIAKYKPKVVYLQHYMSFTTDWRLWVQDAAPVKSENFIISLSCSSTDMPIAWKEVECAGADIMYIYNMAGLEGKCVHGSWNLK